MITGKREKIHIYYKGSEEKTKKRNNIEYE